MVYTRFNREKVGKGYALEQLLLHIEEDYPKVYDGFFVFDADNVLDCRFVEEMNRTFSDGYEVVTSYRNSKNYGDNWISAGYALWFIRESRYLNNSRMLLGTSCAVSGTGFLFSRQVMESTNGWKFHLLTEDIEFSVHHILQGRKIGFCADAVLYDGAAGHLPPVLAAAAALGQGLSPGVPQVWLWPGEGHWKGALLLL